jgi:hypothetical protein
MSLYKKAHAEERKHKKQTKEENKEMYVIKNNSNTVKKNFVDHNLTVEANSRSASREILLPSCSSQVHYHVHKSPSIGPCSESD